MIGQKPMFYQSIKQKKRILLFFATLRLYHKAKPAARVFYISFVFSNARRVLSQSSTRLRLLYLLIKIFT